MLVGHYAKTPPEALIYRHFRRFSGIDVETRARIMYSMIQLEWLFFRLVKYHFCADIVNLV